MKRLWILSLALLLSTAAAQGANLVAYGPSTDDEVTYVTGAGHTVTVWNDVTWQAASAADFAPFDAILVGDSGCGDPNAPTELWANKALWGPLVTGNVMMHGFDDHNDADNDYDGLIVNCAQFAGSGDGLGLCISIQCVSVAAGAAPEGSFAGTFTIPGLGDFEVDGQDGDGIEIVAPQHPAMAGLTDAALDCWGNSVHTHIQSFPFDFSVLAVDNGISCGDGPEEPGGDGATGPVIIAKSRRVTIQEIPTLSNVALAALAVLLAAVAAVVLRRRVRA